MKSLRDSSGRFTWIATAVLNPVYNDSVKLIRMGNSIMILGETEALMFDRLPFLGQVPIASPMYVNAGRNFYSSSQPTSYEAVGPGSAPAATPEVAGPCFTCTNPSSGDTQYGVDAPTAASLKGQGYLCRGDQCANQPSMPITFPGVADLPAAPPEFGDYGTVYGMTGRIPLSHGLGRRALL